MTSRRVKQEQQQANVVGTANVVAFANAMQVGCFHHTSSIAAAGMFEGIFREDMFAEAENLEHPYFRTKHDSEAHRAQGLQGALARLSPCCRGR